MNSFWRCFVEIIDKRSPDIRGILFISCLILVIIWILYKLKGLKFSKIDFGALVSWVILSFSMSLVIVVAFFNRTRYEEYMFEFMPFQSYVCWLKERDIYRMIENLLNIAMFIPLGTLLPTCFRVFEYNRYTFFILFPSSHFLTFLSS